MSHPTAPHRCTAVNRTVYILTFENGGWYEALTEIEGVELDDYMQRFGVLGVYDSQELAERVGTEWADQQVTNRIDGGESPSESEEDNDQEGWGSSSTRSNFITSLWSYCRCSYQSEFVKVMVEERTVLSYVPWHDPEMEDNDEEDSDTDESEEDEEDEEKGEEKDKKEDEEKEKEKDDEKDEKKKDEKTNDKRDEEKDKKEGKLSNDTVQGKDDEENENASRESHHSGKTDEGTVDGDLTKLTGKRKREGGDV